jgi:hypothetical protein
MSQAKKVDERALGLIQPSRATASLPKLSDITGEDGPAHRLANRKPIKKKTAPSKPRGPKFDPSTLVKLNTVKRDLRTIEEIQEEIRERKKVTAKREEKKDELKREKTPVQSAFREPVQREKIIAVPIKDLNAQM